MRTREELLNSLVSFSEPVNSLMREIGKYDWDCEEELVVLMPENIQNVLEMFLRSSISAEEVRSWANAIERREDIGLLESYEETLSEMVFWLANPEINYPINHELANRIVHILQKSGSNK